MKEIKLTQGKFALVDDEDYEYVNQFSWCLRKTKSYMYAYGGLKIDGEFKTVQMHRLIMNPPKGMLVDHKNGDGLDNRRNNLRICTRSQNCVNRVRTKGSKSKYLGVGWCNYRNKWLVKITVKGKQRCIGKFGSELEAAIIANISMRKYYGEFANPNNLTKISY